MLTNIICAQIINKCVWGTPWDLVAPRDMDGDATQGRKFILSLQLHTWGSRVLSRSDRFNMAFVTQHGPRAKSRVCHPMY